ncbi:MAG: aminopeptidase [Bacteroidia bacterium]|nr:aminopeptidase [Bacteroidia bacterium]
MRKSIVYILLLFTGISGFTQRVYKTGPYRITVEKENAYTNVKNQEKTNTCWSYSACSFLESELIRTGKGDSDLSEMFIVRNTYPQKAETYLNNKGNVPFSAGGLGHDVLNCMRNAGLMPEDAYRTNLKAEGVLDETEAHKAMETAVKEWAAAPNPPSDWKNTFVAMAERKIGEVPPAFEYSGKKFTPRSFADSLYLNPDDYTGFTSFLHHPFYQSFAIEVPDNFSKGSYWNLPLVEFTELAKTAIHQGYTLIWDGDVSNDGFSSEKGLAIVPEQENKKEYFIQYLPEKTITEDERQAAFDTQTLTDDHLMHIVGLAQAQDGSTYFVVKNSWGEKGEAKGFIYMSEAYFSLYTISFITHKAVVPADIREKMEWK